MNIQQQKEQEAFESYFNTWFGVDGKNVIKEIEKDLEKVKNISNLEEKSKEIKWTIGKHSRNEVEITSHWNDGKLAELGINYADTLGKYEKLIRELKSIVAETDEKINATTCKYCQKKNLTNPYIWLKGSEHEEVFCDENCLNNGYLAPCDKCQKSRYGVNWHRLNKNDNKRFCSENCCNAYYPPICEFCYQEISGKVQYRNLLDRTGKICSTCNDKRKEELERLFKNLKNNKHRERKREQIQTLSPLTCPQCKKKTTSEMVWVEEKANDNKEFCSENCCISYYKGTCANCFRLNAPYSWNNLSEDDKLLVEYLETKLNKKIDKDYAKKYCLPDCLNKDSGVNEILRGWTDKDWENFGKWKLNNSSSQQNQQLNKTKEEISQLNSEIAILEKNSSKTPQQNQELESKKNKLKELEAQEKELSKPLPEESLETKISKLEAEISDLEKKSNRTKAEEGVLEEKKRKLEELLAEQQKQSNTVSENKKDNSSDKTALYIGLGIVGVVLVGLVVILVRKSKKKRKKY